MSFDALGLTPELLRAVADQGYTEPTPVQREAIPLVLAGRDLLAGAQTGTGKTAAFVLPMLQLLNAERTPGWKSNGAPEPGRDRAPARSARRRPLADPRPRPHPDPRARAPGRGERPDLRRPPPDPLGRDLRRRRLRAPGPRPARRPRDRRRDARPPPRPRRASARSTCRSVEILVLDEADRMLDMGFIRDIRQILALLPATARTCCSRRRSRTTSGSSPARSCATRRRSRSRRATRATALVDPGRPPGRPRAQARAALSHLIRSGRIEQALVFTRTKHGANRLAEQLGRDGINAAAIHGNKSQGQRVRALDDFKAGRATILVATEVASRGLDIEELPHVVNYELPMVPEDYVHRIGRTGRAGADRRRDLARLRRRGAAPPRDRAAARPIDPDRGHPGLRARSIDPPGADPPAVGRPALRQPVARQRPASRSRPASVAEPRPIATAARSSRTPARSATPRRPDRTAARVRAATVRGRARRARTSTAVAASPARADAPTTTAARARARAARAVRRRPGTGIGNGQGSRSGWAGGGERMDRNGDPRGRGDRPRDDRGRAAVRAEPGPGLGRQGRPGSRSANFQALPGERLARAERRD